jgi:hypothetical protein
MRYYLALQILDLEKVSQSDEFMPEVVRRASTAAASICLWIRAVYEFAKFERTVGAKTSEFKNFKELYNHWLATLDIGCRL